VSSFVQVLECWDREKEEMVAIKIIRGMKKYRDYRIAHTEHPGAVGGAGSTALVDV
jgi:hypothetical protein